MKHDEICEDTWEAREIERLPYVKIDVPSTAFCYAIYKIGMEEIKIFGMKNSLTLTSLANEIFNSLRDENDERIYTYTDPFMRNFVLESTKGGRCAALTQSYKSYISDKVFNIISEDLGVIGVLCAILEKKLKF